MKKAIKYFSFGLSAVLALSACSDQFLQDKKNYDNVTTDVYNYVEGANARLNDIYGWCLPQVADLTTGTNYLSVSIGNNDHLHRPADCPVVNGYFKWCARLLHGCS